MGQERRFPCPACGKEFHYKPDEPRISVPCSGCGERLTMPHGSFDMTHAVGMSDDMPAFVMGRDSGGMTQDEWQEVYRRHAMWALRQWLLISPDDPSKAAEFKAADRELYSALSTFESRSVIVKGKRFKADRKTGRVVVTNVEPKK